MHTDKSYVCCCVFLELSEIQGYLFINISQSHLNEVLSFLFIKALHGTVFAGSSLTYDLFSPINGLVQDSSN